ncbi:hypothetical protein FACS1894130_13080 [Spirochaetia bacterium]|nr:hypothetical protein FACS1894130_13080 [Spirochaetia bacterium]
MLHLVIAVVLVFLAIAATIIHGVVLLRLRRKFKQEQEDREGKS